MTEISDLPKLEKIVEQEIVYIDRPGHLPKDQRKTILFLSDDIRVHSGVAIMANEIVEGTCHYYNWVQIGAAINTPNVGSMIEFSEEMQKRTGVRDASVKIIPYNGYGDSRVLREVLKKEKIDAVLHFTDPRYWIWLYQLEHEIRQYIPLFFYAIWDNIPFPYYNENYYRSCDWIGTISKQTYNIVKNVIRKETREPWQLTYVPHGINPSKFYKITEPEELEDLGKMKEQLFRGKDIEFAVLYNSRNIIRKQTSDVLLAFNHFFQKLTPEEQDKTLLIMHTQPVDEAGTDLPRVIEDVMPNINVAFSNFRVDTHTLNSIYNIADVTINIASNEGFGLSTAESIMAETPIIVNVTGGLQDQCGFTDENGEYLTPEKHFTKEWSTNHDGKYKNHGEWATPLFPVNSSLKGSPITPYIFDDRCDWKEAGDAMYKFYMLKKENKEALKILGAEGRKFMLGDGGLNSENMCNLFIQNMTIAMEKFTPRKRFTLLKA
jgi:glycosyltransferase involved in cell wall biosynthesis